MEKQLWATIEHWQQRRLTRGHIGPITHQNQLVGLKSFADFVGPDTPLDHIRTDDFEDWLGHLGTVGSPRGGDYQPSTINTKAAPVRKFFSDMTRRGHIRRDPCVDVPRRRVPARLPRSLPADVLDRLIAHAGSQRNRALIITAATTGLRASELARMRIENWDRETQRLLITRSKTGREDHVWIVGQTEEELGALVKYGLNDAKSGPFWLSPRGEPLKGPTISKLVRHVANDADVRATAHMLRHTFAKGHADRGVPLHILQRLLAHDSPTSTGMYITATELDAYQAMVTQDTVGRPHRKAS